MNLHGIERLLEHISQGDEQAFACLFDMYKDKIYSVTFKLTESTSQAEDTVQDVFLKLWLKRETLTNIIDFENYLFVMIRNEVYAAFRSTVRQKKLSDELTHIRPVFDNCTFNVVMEKEYTQVLEEGVNRLSDQQRKVYLLSKQTDMKRDEIAKVLNISPETVKTHLTRAIRHIRAYSMSRLDLQLAWFLIFF